MKKWEVTVRQLVRLDDDERVDNNVNGLTLIPNQMGDQGWELVTILPINRWLTAFFQREITGVPDSQAKLDEIRKVATRNSSDHAFLLSEILRALGESGAVTGQT